MLGPSSPCDVVLVLHRPLLCLIHLPNPLHSAALANPINNGLLSACRIEVRSQATPEATAAVPALLGMGLLPASALSAALVNPVVGSWSFAVGEAAGATTLERT